jgi:tetratricopeptide (TPR) repeat protein
MLGQVEIAYRLRNEYPHLLDIYQEDVAEHGPTSPAAPQLAWGLMNLGQEQQARQLIDQLLLVSPDEAMTWVLDGLFFLKNGETSPETLADAAVSWGRAINVGPEDPATAQVRRDLEALLERGELDRPQLTEARDRLAERLAKIRERYPDLADAAPTTPGPVRDDTEPPSDSSTGDVEAAGEERAGVATPELASGAGGADSPDVRNAPNTERRAAGEADGASDAKTGSSAPPPTAAEERTDGERAALQIARGRIDLQRGSRDEALGHYRRAEELGTSSPRDLFAMMRLGWDLDRDRAKQRRRFAALVDRDDLDARLIYDLALFAGGALEDGPAAISLLERLVRDHATFAERVDAAALIRKYREE